MGWVEETFFFEFFTELAEGEFQGAHTGGGDFFGDELVLAPRAIDVDRAMDQDGEAVGKFEFEVHGTGSPHGAADLGLIVFQGEIDVA